MNLVKSSFTILLATVLAACGSPEDRANDVIADFCDAYRDNDHEALKELTTSREFSNFNLSSAEEREKAECGEQVKKISDKKFIFILKESGFAAPVKVEEVNGVFQVTGFNM
ncbi:hypothetical protein [Thalassotalea agarivorans]|uniref:Lipoprotein n=1 Tax=Thalassotalea agarivorans TaxID=349064 RepID=A0A1I0H4D5_THASX|nr:hypothetical protein [Thalassotalea agarivorans]SET78547.1 hypothetical protein SAMN05660429_02684 [Thalassotalea agarivorans]